MKGKGQQKTVNLRRLVSQAQRRYLDRGYSRAYELSNIRAKTTENLCRAIFEVLTGAFGVSEDEYDAIARLINDYSRQYREMSEQCGEGKARGWLSELTKGGKCIDFALPIDETPKKARDWENLACKRAAGALTAKLYACAMRKTLKMDDQQITDVLEAAKERYKSICLYES